ncbi:MAG: flagellar hook capping FlgD N-terminal domain-containing protein [Planctomycetota bacterium]
MSSINNPSSINAATEFTSSELNSQVSSNANDAYNALDTDDFLKLLINELQNQDPLDPVDNAAMIEQLGQIREIGASDELSSTLTELSDSQQLVTASGLIGQTVDGLDDTGSNVSGVVDKITVTTNEENAARSVKVHIGTKTMNIENIREIQTG